MWIDTFQSQGFSIHDALIGCAEAATLAAELETLQVESEAVRAKNQRTYAVRNLLDWSPGVRRLADDSRVRSVAEAAVGPGAKVVRAILFDKSPEANWKVAWHQDLSIAVKDRQEVTGFGPWSVKAGVPHVQPPAELLDRMATLRIHLDDCGVENGPLQVIAGSHRHGAMSPEQVAEWTRRESPVFCTLPAGGCVVMKPLILHASSSSTAGRRRVIHLEWSADELPGGLEWHVA